MRGGVFDLDGTLASTATAHLRAWQLALSEIGVTNVNVDLRKLLGMRAFDIAKEVASAAGLDFSRIDELIELKSKHFDSIAPALTRPMPCANDIASSLRRRGMKLVVVTSSLRRGASTVLRSIGIEPDVLVAGDDVARGKPDPQPIVFALSLAGLTPDDVFAVGDTLNDLRAYRGAGIGRVYIVRGDVEIPVDEGELSALNAVRAKTLCDVMSLEGLT